MAECPRTLGYIRFFNPIFLKDLKNHFKNRLKISVFETNPNFHTSIFPEQGFCQTLSTLYKLKKRTNFRQVSRE